MAQGFDVLISQQLGELVATLHRQDGSDRVELCDPSLNGRKILSGLAGLCHHSTAAWGRQRAITCSISLRYS
ncbi:hypothetical protein D3C72_288950 [compost metagenome]